MQPEISLRTGIDNRVYQSLESGINSLWLVFGPGYFISVFEPLGSYLKSKML